MLTGRLPFKGGAPGAVLNSILNDRPERLTALRSGLPVELDRIMGKALGKDPSERYQHLDEMLVDLTAVGKGPPEERLDTGPSPARAWTKPFLRPYTYLGAAAMLILLILAVWYGYWPNSATQQPRQAGIAVLPLEDLSGADSPEYFGEGMTDALISELGAISGLRVISRTSVMRFKRSEEPLSRIAAQLNVDHVVEGTSGVRRAVEHFQRAIEVDPSFALAYAAQARCYAVGGGIPELNRMELRRRAVQAATKALELDEATAEAHNALGWIRLYFDYNWQGAEQAYRRALELNPNLSDAFHRCSHYLMVMGRFEEGLEASRRALDLDPFDRRIVGHYVWALFMARRYEEARRYCQAVLDADPDNFNARIYSYQVFEHFGEYQRIIGQPDRTPKTVLARAYALAGQREKARQLLEEAATSLEEWDTQCSVALVHLALGDKPAAMKWLDLAFVRRAYPLPDISVDPRFDPLRKEKAFQGLLARMGLKTEDR